MCRCWTVKWINLDKKIALFHWVVNSDRVISQKRPTSTPYCNLQDWVGHVGGARCHTLTIYGGYDVQVLLWIQ